MTEQQIHRSIVDYLNLALPRGSVVHHSPNEGNHKVQYRIKQKHMGVRAGWPDIEIFVSRTWWRPDQPWSPWFLEIKTPKGRVSTNQSQVHTDLIGAGCRVAIVRSIEETQNFLLQYIELRHA